MINNKPSNNIYVISKTQKQLTAGGYKINLKPSYNIKVKDTKNIINSSRSLKRINIKVDSMNFNMNSIRNVSKFGSHISSFKNNFKKEAFNFDLSQENSLNSKFTSSYRHSLFEILPKNNKVNYNCNIFYNNNKITQINNYVKMKKIGNGAFGVVYLYKNLNNNKYYALKIVKTKYNTDDIIREIYINLIIVG